MFTILILVVGSLTIIVMLLLLIVAIGIQQERSVDGLSEQAPSLIAGFVRHFHGVYIRKPDSPRMLDQDDKGHASLLAGSMDKPNTE